ncbi:MAG TPA: IS110 family transposase [Thermoguttaceae bacterium]|nr:IS110 family transposase [Thermoguttaceae bacterium]
MARYLGVDLHRNNFTVCTIAENGRRYFREYDIHSLNYFAGRLRPSDQVAVEVSTTTRLFYDAVAPHVEHVAVVNSSQFDVIRKSVKKTDRNDAEALALFLSKGLLPEVRMKDKLHAELASLTQTRDTLVKQRTALKNKINNIMAARGLSPRREQLSSEKGLRAVEGLPLGPVVLVEVRALVAQIRSLNQTISELEKTIKTEGEKLPGHKNLKSIKGIGDTSATILLSIIGDIDEFQSEGKLASYFGIVPRVRNSNETEHSGRITKRGTKLGRTTLVQLSLPKNTSEGDDSH